MVWRVGVAWRLTGTLGIYLANLKGTMTTWHAHSRVSPYAKSGIHAEKLDKCLNKSLIIDY
jgi:hypothetical protein